MAGQCTRALSSRAVAAAAAAAAAACLLYSQRAAVLADANVYMHRGACVLLFFLLLVAEAVFFRGCDLIFPWSASLFVFCSG